MKKMALTRNFRETVLARAKQDDEFRIALLMEAIDLLLEGDIETAKKHLRDYIHASISMETLAKKVDKDKANIQRMLSAGGNPGIKSLFPIIKALQDYEGIQITTTRR
jgi:DNA-binding phage protein